MSNLHALQPGVRAAYLHNQRGDVCIAFDDPAYVRSDSIMIGGDGTSIHAVLHESAQLLGHVSPEMVKAFRQRKMALLTAVRPNGTIFEMMAPIAQEESSKTGGG